MHEVFAPLEAEAVKNDGEHLEVIVLLVAYDIYHLVDGVIVEALFGCTDILSHVYRSAVATEKQFLIKAVLTQVCPYRAILAAIENAFIEPFEYFGFAVEISL